MRRAAWRVTGLMVIAGARYELIVPSASSLKDKRRVIKGLLERLRNRYNVSAAEVGNQDNWQRASIGVAAISSKQYHAREVVDSVTRHVEGCIDVEITCVDVEFFHEGD